MRWFAAAVITCILGALPVCAGAQPSLEADVKAAFLLNFPRYIEWPRSRDSSTFWMCVLRDDAFAARLGSVVAGEHWNDLPMQVRVVQEASPGDCHLLYVPAAMGGRFSAQRLAMSDPAVLTVGDGAKFIQQGGMIRLFVEQNHVRFSINLAAADSAGLRISSRLLRLARDVVGSK